MVAKSALRVDLTGENNLSMLYPNKTILSSSSIAGICQTRIF